MANVLMRRGFTLIELLVVFTLLALLLSIAVPRYLQYADGARMKAREQNIATLRDALDKFKSDRGVYPTDLNELVLRKYLRDVPIDPVTQTRDWVTLKDTASRDHGISDVLPPADVESDTAQDVLLNSNDKDLPAPTDSTATSQSTMKPTASRESAP